MVSSVWKIIHNIPISIEYICRYYCELGSLRSKQVASNLAELEYPSFNTAKSLLDRHRFFYIQMPSGNCIWSLSDIIAVLRTFCLSLEHTTSIFFNSKNVVIIKCFIIIIIFLSWFQFQLARNGTLKRIFRYAMIHIDYQCYICVIKINL